MEPLNRCSINMIDSFSKIANALQILRIPSVAIGLISLLILITTIISSKSHAEDLYLIPSAVGVLWSLATYSFLVNFRSVPEKADPSWKFFQRFKRNIARSGYWLMGIFFIGTTIGVLTMSYRMIAIWLREYGV